MNIPYAFARITPSTSVRRVHRLPEGSVPRVVEGQIVKASDTLAVLDVASEHRTLRLAEGLGVETEEVEAYLLAQPGERVEEGDILAQRKGFLGLRERQVAAPIAGRIVSVENGVLLLEGERIRVEIEATMPGRVASVEPEAQAVIEATAAVIQLAWGRGELAWGTLKVMDGLPSLQTNAGRFNIDHRGAIVVIGSPLTAEFLEGAAAIRVKGVIAASLPARLLPALDGLDFPVGVTQGFGSVPMSGEVLRLFETYDGREAVLDMGESTDWRDRRPETIIPLSSQQREPARDRSGPGPLRTGQKVRVLQVPYFGKIGTIMGLPGEPRRLPSGLWAQGALVEIEDAEPGNGVFVPHANLEQLG